MRLVAEYLKHAEFCRTLADMAQPQDKKILEELADGHSATLIYPPHLPWFWERS
jgi:hypothetical protein